MALLQKGDAVGWDTSWDTTAAMSDPHRKSSNAQANGRSKTSNALQGLQVAGKSISDSDICDIGKLSTESSRNEHMKILTWGYLTEEDIAQKVANESS